MDVHLLLGLANTTLRNDCASLEDLARTHDLEVSVLVKRLAKISMEYSPEQNQFKDAASLRT